MPNGRTHRKLGAVAGGAAALSHARGEPPRAKAVETLGGVVGGMIGGMLPDRFDPPISPRHRGAWHSVLLLVVLLCIVLEHQRKACRERAEQAHGWGIAGPEPTLESDGWLFASGLITGVQWGYISHLAADMTTSAGLPLVCKGH